MYSVKYIESVLLYYTQYQQMQLIVHIIMLPYCSYTFRPITRHHQGDRTKIQNIRKYNRPKQQFILYCIIIVYNIDRMVCIITALYVLAECSITTIKHFYGCNTVFY